MSIDLLPLPMRVEIRCRFASAALAALIENHGRYSAADKRHPGRSHKDFAREAWKFADALFDAMDEDGD